MGPRQLGRASRGLRAEPAEEPLQAGPCGRALSVPTRLTSTTVLLARPGQWPGPRRQRQAWLPAGGRRLGLVPAGARAPTGRPLPLGVPALGACPTPALQLHGGHNELRAIDGDTVGPTEGAEGASRRFPVVFLSFSSGRSEGETTEPAP